jgi:hypothetical protein
MHGREIQLARSPKQLAQILDRVLAGRMSELVGERAYRKRVWQIEDGAIPTDPQMVRGRPVLATYIRYRVRHVRDTLLKLAGAAVGDIGLERSLDRGKYGAMQPGGRISVGI